MSEEQYGFAVHGGAWDMPQHVKADHRAGCLEAFRIGENILAEGGSALDAVEAAVCILEDNPTFDAGRGAFLNEDGFVQLDAGMMDGHAMNFGAVAAVEGVRNPIILARRVLDSEHMLLVGEGATRFARQHDIATNQHEWLIVERERELWASLKERDKVSASEFFVTPQAKGTVGAVARDVHGNVAAATSTGGTPFKPLGRVGDTPICGAGFYARNHHGACSTTGWGEAIIKVFLAHAAVSRAGEKDAAQQAIDLLADVGGAGGLILLDNAGKASVAFNTSTMAFAFRDQLAGDIICGPD
jgi:beta-aspartyl-peptidase (threonine type)